MPPEWGDLGMGAPFFVSMKCCRSKLKMGQRPYLSYLLYCICIYYVSTGPEPKFCSISHREKMRQKGGGGGPRCG